MLVTYPALFYYDDSDKLKAHYFIHFPDFPELSGTQGEDSNDAMNMAIDWLGINLADCIKNNIELPKASKIEQLSLLNNNPFKNNTDFKMNFDFEKSFISLVTVNTEQYIQK